MFNMDAASVQTSTAPQTQRMLIVDDEPAIRNILAKIATAEGFLCDTSPNAADAMQRLAETNYQIVLSDIHMPGLDGSHLAKHVSTHYPETAVIMVTGMGDAETAVNAFTAGAYDYVTKPFVVPDLTGTIYKALERSELLKQNRRFRAHLEERLKQQTGELQNAMSRITQAYGATLEALISVLDAREQETQRHSRRVSEYALLMARQLGMSSIELMEIERGSLLHDIGKIGIADHILLKPAKLTEEEWVEMRKHPEIGYNILRGVDFLAGSAKMVLQHHERFDGAGYPAGLAGETILPAARIFAVVDTYDAMTSHRPYRKALGYEAARAEIIRCSGSQFDPAMVECFLSIPEKTWGDIRENLEAARP